MSCVVLRNRSSIIKLEGKREETVVTTVVFDAAVSELSGTTSQPSTATLPSNSQSTASDVKEASEQPSPSIVTTLDSQPSTSTVNESELQQSSSNALEPQSKISAVNESDLQSIPSNAAESDTELCSSEEKDSDSKPTTSNAPEAVLQQIPPIINESSNINSSTAISSEEQSISPTENKANVQSSLPNNQKPAPISSTIKVSDSLPSISSNNTSDPQLVSKNSFAKSSSSSSNASCVQPSTSSKTLDPQRSTSTETSSGSQPNLSRTPLATVAGSSDDGIRSRKGSTFSQQSKLSSTNDTSSRKGETSIVFPQSLDTLSQFSNLSLLCDSTPTTSVLTEQQTADLAKGIIKCSNVVIGFAPVKRKKTYFAVLSKRAFELHDSEKSFRNGKTAKHIIDLATSFNIHNNHYDLKMKRCLCIMGPDETLVMVTESKELTEEWYQALLQALLLARQTKLGRPCQPFEVFESVYDVEVVPHTKNAEKYRKSRKEDGYVNLCETMKDISGNKRLCFYSHTVVLANRRIEPTVYGCPDSGFPPFRADAIIEFPRPLIATFGCREKYFFLRLGSGVVLGGTELLVLCDSIEVSTSIHQTLRNIIDREAGRRIHMVMPSTLQMRNERIQQERNLERTSHKRVSDSPTPEMESLSVPSPHLHHRNMISLDSTPLLTAKDRRLRLLDSLSFASIEINDSAPSSPFGNNRPRCSLGSFQDMHLARPRRSSNTIRYVKEEPGLQEAMRAAIQKKHSTQSDRGEVEAALGGRKFSKNNRGDSLNKAGSTSSLTKERMLKSPSIYSTMINAEDGTPIEGECEEEQDPNEPSTSTPRKKKSYQLLSNDATYSKMDPSEWRYPSARNPLPRDPPPPPQKEEIVYNLEEARSYISDSSDSCYSSSMNNSTSVVNSNQQLATVKNTNLNPVNAPRANSFGGRSVTGEQAPQKPKISKSLKKETDKKKNVSKSKDDNSSNNLTVDDARKRAFSLGSKNLFSFIGLNDFRRLVKKPKRPNSPNHTSTSGISLSSSTASPSSSSTNFLASIDLHEDARLRSGSFGSGRSSPFGRHAYPTPAPSRDTDHHVEMEFPSLSTSKGRLGSSNSIESPIRTSSFGSVFNRPGEDCFGYPSLQKAKNEREEEKDRPLRYIEKVPSHNPNKHRSYEPIPGEYMYSDPFTQKILNSIYSHDNRPKFVHTTTKYEAPIFEKPSSSRRDDDKKEFHPKTSLCGLIVEEKEDEERNESKHVDSWKEDEVKTDVETKVSNENPSITPVASVNSILAETAAGS